MLLGVVTFIIIISLIIITLRVIKLVITFHYKGKGRLDGKTVLITGGSKGIGYETAKDLARRGAKVIIASRSKEDNEVAVRSIIEATGNTKVRFENLDLSSFDSIRKLVARIEAEEERLDILINNAALALDAKKRFTTQDGFESEVQANHLGPAMLTLLLLPMMKKSIPARIIMVSSMNHWLIPKSYLFKILEGKTYFKEFTLSVYSATKLCNIHFARELARRVEKFNITVNSLHPGVITNTSILNNLLDLYHHLGLIYLYNHICKYFLKVPEEGAQTTIFCAVDESLNDVTGKYFSGPRLGWLSPAARDDQLAKEVWDYTLDRINMREYASAIFN